MSDYRYGIAWSDDYSLGYERVDAQHRRLFELLSELVSSCMEGTDVDKLHKTIDFLVNYTIQHFSDEEALQIEYGYPGYVRHKQLHENFKATVGDLVQRFTQSGSLSELSADVNKVIVKWLITHIQREDKKIGAHIKAQI